MIKQQQRGRHSADSASIRNDRQPNRYWGNHQPPTSKAEFFNTVTTLAPDGGGSVATIRMYGPIDSWGDWWGISAEEVAEALATIGNDVSQIILRINSPGGEVFEAMAILNMLRSHPAKITAVVDGLAASAASVITAGADESVMSPGTQMMIHSPSSFTWGTAVDMRKTADILDSIQASLIEIYQAKAGDADWVALLAEETWLTGPEALAHGLIDRVGVVADAGQTVNAGQDDDLDDDTVIVVPIEADDVEDAAARVAAIAAAIGGTPKLPSSTEPGDPNRKELPVSDTLKAGLRERLGITDADASEETLLAALDARTATPTQPTAHTAAPEGTTLVDSAMFTQLQRDAAAGAEARAQQTSDKRDGIIASAVAEGRISPSSRDSWRASLDKDEDGVVALIASLAPNTVPVAELGHSDTISSSDDALYAAYMGTDQKGA